MYLKFGVTEAWESIETENSIHLELHPFLIFHILKHPAALLVPRSTQNSPGNSPTCTCTCTCS